MRILPTFLSFLIILLASGLASATVLWSDNFNDGDYTNNPTWSVYSGSSASIVNNALHFTNAGTTYMESPNGIINPSGIYNLSWDEKFLINNPAESKHYSVLLQDYQTSSWAGYIDIRNTGSDIFITLSTYNNATGNILSNEVNDGNAHNYKLSFDTSTNILKLYIDGVFKTDILNAVFPINISYVEVDSFNSGLNTTGDYFDNFVLSDTASTASTISGHVYEYQNVAPSNVLTKELQFLTTTQEYRSYSISNAYTQYTQVHALPNFFYYSRLQDPMGGEVYVDEFAADGSQAELQIHTPWDTWHDVWVDTGAYVTYTYAGGAPAWIGDSYRVYLNTFVGYSSSGVILKTQYTSATHSASAYFVKPYCIGLDDYHGLCGGADYASMPNGGGVYNQFLQNRTRQAIYVNFSSSIPDLTNISSYKIRVHARTANTNGGYFTVTDPLTMFAYSIPDLSRLSDLYTRHNVYQSLPAGNIAWDWYEISNSSFILPLNSNPYFEIAIGENTYINDVQLVVTYNQDISIQQPLFNVQVTANATTNTTTDVNGYYSISVPDTGSYPIGYNGFYSLKNGDPFYGEQKEVYFSGGTTGDDVWLNESVPNMAGQLAFSGITNATFAIGQQMNVSYTLFHSDRTNYTYSIDLYKPESDYSQNLVIDASTTILDDYGHWLPSQDMTTIGTRKFYLNYTSILGGTPTTLATLTGSYGAIEPNGTITTDKPNYNYNETALINYSSNINGRILITCPGCLNEYNSTYDITAGNNKTLYFSIDAPLQYGQYHAWLQYNTFGDNWNVLDMALFTVVPNQSYVNFGYSSYYLGQSMQMFVYQTNNGYLLLKDSNNAVKDNFTNMPVNNFSSHVYFTQFTDPIGTWTAELHNATGVIVATATTQVLDSNASNITATSTTPPPGWTTCPGGSAICEGVQWTSLDTWHFLSSNLPWFSWVLLLILGATAIVGTVNIWRRKR